MRIQLDHEADRRELNSAARVDLQWVESLADAVSDLEIPEGDGFVWAAGEHSDMAQLRRTLFAKPGANPKRMRISAYWKRGDAGHHEELGEA